MYMIRFKLKMTLRTKLFQQFRNNLKTTVRTSDHDLYLKSGITFEKGELKRQVNYGFIKQIYFKIFINITYNLYKISLN